MPSREPTKQAGWQHDPCRLKLPEKGNKNVPHEKSPLGCWLRVVLTKKKWVIEDHPNSDR